MASRALTLWTVMLLATWGGVVLGDALLVEPRWSSELVAGVHMLLLMAGTLVGLLGLIVGLLALRRSAVPGSNRRALVLLLASLTASVGGTYAGDSIRIAGFRRCGERLNPLVATLREYETLHGSPPTSPADLGPTAPPLETGLKAYPRVLYETSNADATMSGNRWILRVEAFRGTGWDQFIFLPNANYPKVGFGGTIERVGEWAYVWE
jgi:hypothetical protein